MVRIVCILLTWSREKWTTGGFIRPGGKKGPSQDFFDLLFVRAFEKDNPFGSMPIGQRQ